MLRHSSTRFYDNLIRGVEEVADRHHALVVTAASRTPERERATLLALSSRRVNGLLVVPIGSDHPLLQPEQAAGMPLVFVDHPPNGVDADTVLTDDLGGGRSATEHLLHRGHRRIGMVGAGAHLHTVAQRVAGYRAALADAGIPAPAELVKLERDDAGAAYAATMDLLSQPQPPTALFTLNNVCTIGAVRALRDAGAQRRVALVGFDDFELADLLDPPVTVIAHDVVAMGRMAAEWLFACIDG